MEVIKMFNQRPFVSVSSKSFEVELVTPIGCFIYYDESFLFLNKGDLIVLEENGKVYEIQEKIYHAYLKQWKYLLKIVR